MSYDDLLDRYDELRQQRKDDGPDERPCEQCLGSGVKPWFDRGVRQDPQTEDWGEDPCPRCGGSGVEPMTNPTTGTR